MGRELRSSVAGAAVDAYDRHVGRYGPELAREMVRVTGVRAGQRALDVGCGTGGLTVTLTGEASWHGQGRFNRLKGMDVSARVQSPRRYANGEVRFGTRAVE